MAGLFLFLFLLLIPTQLGKHFWPEWSSVMGVRVDYLSPVLYLVDLVWLGWAVSKLKIKKWKLSFEIILVGLLVILNILVAVNKWVAIYRWLRIGQWLLTLYWIKKDKRMVVDYLKKVIPWWIGVESLLGLAQTIKGGSLNGVWYWLGERKFDFGSLGIAQISLVGKGLVRAYGTFSHPNSLAGFLLVAMMLWLGFYKKTPKVGWWVVTWLGIIGLLITGSRTVWLVGIVGLLAQIKSYDWKKKLGYSAVVIGLLMLILGVIGVNYRISDFVGGWDGDSLAKRVNLNMVGMKMWKENFFLGVGAGNFIVRLPEYQGGSRFYWLQPIHNIFLLAGVEMGMLGVIMILKLAIFNFKFSKTKKSYLILGIIMVTGMVDHYWMTLPQNSWLLAVVLGVI